MLSNMVKFSYAAGSHRFWPGLDCPLHHQKWPYLRDCQPLVDVDMAEVNHGDFLT